MKKCMAILILMFSAQSIFGQWIQQSSPTKRDLYDIKFFENKGIIVGDSIILTSNDSGETWSQQNFNGILFKCGFQSKDTIWGAGLRLYSQYSNLVVRTTDGGMNWDSINIAGTDTVYGYCESVFFKDKMHGWIGGGSGVSRGGYIFSTKDGGQSWHRVNIDSSDFMGISFLDTLNGWACSWTGGKIYNTTNGGETWNFNYKIQAGHYPLRDIFFTSLDSGWTVGGIASTSLIVRTTDGGITWIEKKDEFPSDFRSVNFINSKIGWAVGGFGLSIIQTTDGGESWSLQKQPVTMEMTQTFESIYMLNLNTGYVIADSGIILKTTNGGILTEINIAPVLPDKIELYQNYPNPFNPSTKISYNLTERSFIILKIYDNLGREIKTIVNKDQYAGFHSVTFDGKNLPSGIYYYKLQAGDFSQTKKLILLK